MITTLLLFLLFALILSAILDAWPSRALANAVFVVLLLMLALWLLSGTGAQTAW